MIVIGLTGSIGMGKSSVAAMFEKLGVPCHDADAAAHRALEPKSEGYFAVTAAFPFYKYPEIYKKRLGPFGKIKYLDRKALGKIVFADEHKRRELEGILHPLVRKDQNKFIADMGKMGRDIVLLDIPLLFETGADLTVDAVVNVEAPYFVQRARVLSRANMDEQKFHSILKKQMPSKEKSARADYVIPTGLSRAETFRAVKNTLLNIKANSSPKYVQGLTGRIY